MRLWLSVSSKGTVASLNSQAVLTPTFSGQLRSSPVPFLFLVFHIYKNEAERSTPVPSWKESIQPNVGLGLGESWSSSSLPMSSPHHVPRPYLSLSLFPSFLLSFSPPSLTSSHTQPCPLSHQASDSSSPLNGHSRMGHPHEADSQNIHSHPPPRGARTFSIPGVPHSVGGLAKGARGPRPPCHDVITGQLTLIWRRIPELKWTGSSCSGLPWAEKT